MCPARPQRTRQARRPRCRAVFLTRARARRRLPCPRAPQEVLVQAFETSDPAHEPGAGPGLDMGAGPYDAEKPYPRDLYPFSPGPAEPAATFPNTAQPVPVFGSTRLPYTTDTSAAGPYAGPYGGASPPPLDMARPGQQSGTLAPAYAGAGPPGPYSNWRSGGAAPQAAQGNPGAGFGYGGGYGAAAAPDVYGGWSGGAGGGGYDSARNAEAGRWYPPDAYQGVA